MATVTAMPNVKIAGGSFLIEERKPEEVFTPEDFTEQHLLIARTAEEFAIKEIVPNIEKLEHKDFALLRELVRKAGELGLSGADVPEQYGGMELDKVTSALIADRLARYGGFSATWGAHTCIGTLPIVYFGTEQQKKKYLPGLASGETVGAYALSESSSGSDALNCRTKAHLSGDGKHYVLNGEKMWITNGSLADVALVWAKGEDGRIRGFLVEKGTTGFKAWDVHGKLSLRASITSGLSFTDCEIPAENMLPGVEGLRGPLSCLTQARYGIGWGTIGAAMACYQTALEYAKTRRQFGNKPIAGHQLVQDKLVWMITEISKAQLLALHVGRLKDEDRATPEHISMLKMNNTWMAR
jgi:glutaryl-CoA dehydrogenase